MLQIDPAARVAAHRSGREPAHHHGCGVGPVCRVGDDDALRVAPLRQVMGADDEQPRELAVGAGRRLQRGARQAGDLRQPLAELPHELEGALRQRLRLIGVQPGEALELSRRLVETRVVLHRAGAQRVAAAVHSEVERREAGEVAYDVDFAHLRQPRRRLAAQAVRDEVVERDLGHVRRRQAVGAPAATGFLVDGAPVETGHALRVSHGPPPRWRRRHSPGRRR